MSTNLLRGAAGLLGLLSLVAAGCRTSHVVNPSPIAYPVTATTNTVDTYHGTAVADPYRWLEDENGEGTRAWVEAENAVTFRYLESLPEREPLRRRLTELYRYDRYGVPSRYGARYFFTRVRGLENQTVLLTADSLEAEPVVLLDPNRLSADGTVALKSFAPNDDGTRVVCALSVAGSDWEEWRVRDVATG